MIGAKPFIICNNACMLLSGIQGNFSEIIIEIHAFQEQITDECKSHNKTKHNKTVVMMPNVS